jgi:hypothetical protein
MSQGKVVAGIKSVTRITVYVRKMSRCLKGNSSPDGKTRGMDKAAASETIPLMPAQPRAVTALHGGIGSLRAIEEKSFLGR